MGDGDVHAGWFTSMRGRKSDSVLKVIFAITLLERFRGLHAYKVFKDVLALIPCRDIHTFGMHEPIDVVFVARDGRVVKSIRELMPRKRIRCSNAVMVLERYASPQDWPDEGSCIRFDWNNQILFTEERKGKL